MWCELAMGTRLLRKHFTTVAELERPHRVEINSYDPMFERFEQIWTFEPAAEGGTDIEYRVDVRCRSRMLQALLEAGSPSRPERWSSPICAGPSACMYGNARPAQ